MKTCAVSWCVCLPREGRRHCVVHEARGEKYRPRECLDADPTVECKDCDGSGECWGCDGDGKHQCEHSGCHESHTCPQCDGTGLCPECRPAQKPTSEEATYLAWAFDAGLTPLPPVCEQPWA